MRIFNIIFLTIFLFIPASVFSSGSATFSGNPQVDFALNENGGLQPTLTGQIQVQGATEDDFFLGVKILQGNNPPTQEQIDSPESLTFLDTVASGAGYAFNSSTSNTLNPGTIYHFVFKIIPNATGITGDVFVVSTTTPGNAPNGNGQGVSEPPCVGCALDSDASIESGNFPGWPENVIPNTLAVSDLNSFVVGLLNALLKIGIPVMTIFLVYSGLRLVMARGNEKELEDAKKNLLWVIIGVAVLLGAWTIVKVLKGTFDELDLAYVISLINFV